MKIDLTAGAGGDQQVLTANPQPRGLGGITGSVKEDGRIRAGIKELILRDRDLAIWELRWRRTCPQPDIA